MLMTRKQLIAAATEYAKNNGWNVDNYTVTDVRRQRQECSVFFSGKSKRPGDHFTVYLDCDTGKVSRLIPGR
jgi:hypothetical protein